MNSKLRRKFSQLDAIRRDNIKYRELQKQCKTCEALKNHNLFLVGQVEVLRDQLEREREVSNKFMNKFIFKEQTIQTIPDYQPVRTTKLASNFIKDEEAQSRAELEKEQFNG